MSRFKLSASVGHGGVNKAEDVIALKTRLIRLGFDWLDGNKKVNNDLIAVIKLVQSMIAGKNTIGGDGRVDVPGLTYKWLRAKNAPTWQLMPKGSAQFGFINVERADLSDHHDYGSGWMAETIQKAGSHYRRKHLLNDPADSLLLINDVSLPKGGDTPDHAGHETGLAADVRLPRKDASGTGGLTYKDVDYDRDALRAMLQALNAQPLVSKILFNDPQLISEGLCIRAKGHDNHVHFDISPPKRRIK